MPKWLHSIYILWKRKKNVFLMFSIHRWISKSWKWIHYYGGLNKVCFRFTPWDIHHRVVPTHSVLMCPPKNQHLMLRQFGLQPDDEKWLSVSVRGKVQCSLFASFYGSCFKGGPWSAPFCTAAVITEDTVCFTQN